MDDQAQSWYEEVAAFALTGLSNAQSEEGHRLIKAIVDDWIDQADDLIIDEVVELGREELREALEGQDAQERLTTLRHLVLARQVGLLSGRSLQLALQFAGGQRSSEEASAEVGVISEAIASLLPWVRALDDDDLRRQLARELADADLECRFVAEGGAGIMSIRLNNMMS